MTKLSRGLMGAGCVAVVAIGSLALMKFKTVGELLPAAPGLDELPLRISMVALLAAGEKFDGRLVTTEGFATLEYEGTALYLNQADWEGNIPMNSLYLSLSEEQVRAFRECDEKHVSITARYAPIGARAAGLYSGMLTGIRSMRKIPSRADMQRR